MMFIWIESSKVMALLKNDTPTEAHPGENVGAEYLGQYEGAWLPRPGQQPPALGLHWKGEINKRRGKISNEKKWSIPSSAAALTRQYVSILQWNLFSCWALKAELNNNWWAQISEGLRWFPGRRWWKDWEELPPITLLHPPSPPSPPNLNEPTVEHNSTPPG